MNIDWLYNLLRFKRDKRRRTLLSNGQIRAVLMVIAICFLSWLFATKFDETEYKFLSMSGVTYGALKYFLRD